MRIALLTTQDLDAPPAPDPDWPCDPRPFLPEHDWRVAVLTKSTGPAAVRSLAADGVELFFNLCDGAADQDAPGIEIVHTLEALGVPFTGATSNFYEPTRAQMKAACRAQGIATPAHVLASTPADVQRAAQTLQFPLFVKHHNSYASVGISRHSRVRTEAGLRRQSAKFMRRFGACLIEEYVDGDECTVLVAETPGDPERPTTYTPLQYVFPPGEAFKHERLKWVDYAGLSCAPVDDPTLEARLRHMSARMFVRLGGASFGRCDIRVDRWGTPWMLEINPNCGIFYPATDAGSADLCLLNDPAGHLGFARQLVAAALARHGARSRSPERPNSLLPWTQEANTGG